MMHVQRQSIALMSQQHGLPSAEIPPTLPTQADFASTMVADYFEAGREMLSVLTAATRNFAQGPIQSHRATGARPKPRGAAD
jgi:hypothetical protein